MHRMQLKEFSITDTATQIRDAAARNHLGHALLFCGGKQRLEAAFYAAAAMECIGAEEHPCLVCEHCRKVLEEIHPDVSFVRAEERKEISAEQCREICADAFLRPNEGTRKIYIFEDGTRLNERDQNILLKMVEDGPPYAAFFFCSESISTFLPTLRSRCGVLHLPEEGDVCISSETVSFCQAITGGAVRRCEFFFSLERSKPTRDMLSSLFEQTEMLWMKILLVQCGRPVQADTPELVCSLAQRFSKEVSVQMIEILRKHRMYCDENAGIGILLGGFLAELEGIL